MIKVSALLLMGGVFAFAQLGGLLKKNPLDGLVKKNNGTTDATAVLTQGQDLLGYVTLATDNGVQAAVDLAAVFPPEKIQKIADLAAKYNEMKSHRVDKNIDAESMKVASQIDAEMAQLDSEGQSYIKEKSAAVKNADARIALVILADGLAGTKAPETAKALQSAAQNLKSDPTQVSNAKRMLAMASMLITVGDEASKQASSLKTVRGITKRIADAEKIQLAADPSPDKVKDQVTLKSAAKELDTDHGPTVGAPAGF
jgi:hypothetical protein